MMNLEFFTSTKESLLEKFFNGSDYKPAKNGVYFVAHTDTVHENLPTADDIQCHRGILTAPERGLGADGFHRKTEYVDTNRMEQLFEVYTGLVDFVINNELDRRDAVGEEAI